MILWHCSDCGARAELPAKDIRTSVRGLHQHMTLNGCVNRRAWHRIRRGHYALVSTEPGERYIGQVVADFGTSLWYATVNVDVTAQWDKPPYGTKREAQRAVEEMADRVVRVLL